MQSTKTSSTTTTVAAIMNSSNQLKTAVENIQDELQRIMAVADLQRVEASVASEEFKTRLIAEFNLKLRGFKSKVRALNEENGRLRKRIAELEKETPLSPRELNARKRRSDRKESEDKRAEKAPTNQDYIAIWGEASGQRPKKTKVAKGDFEKALSGMNSAAGRTTERERTKDQTESRNSEVGGSEISERDTAKFGSAAKFPEMSNAWELPPHPEPGVRILSSPLKSPSKPARDLTSSQFNRLPTQYSDELRDAPGSGSLRPVQLPARAAEPLGLSPIAGAFAESQEVVADSQEEIEPLAQVPPHYTSLQRAQFLRNYYRMKLADSGFCVALTFNPITERAWVADDFKRNARWVPPAVAPSRARAMTKAQEAVYNEFFREAGFGARAAGPQWGDSDADDDGAHENMAPVDIHGARSQVMDKYLSPPGYMVGLFPSTQEAYERKAEIQQKAAERLERRLASALSGGEFVFYEDVLNTYVAQGRYTREAV